MSALFSDYLCDLTPSVDFGYFLGQGRDYNPLRETFVCVVVALASDALWFRCGSSISLEAVLSACSLSGCPSSAPLANLLGLRMDLTGYGLYEFPAIVFALSALAYYLTKRLTGWVLNRVTIQLHFWPSFLFAMCSIFWVHLVNHIPAARVDAPEVQAALHNWLTAFMWAFVAFIAIQVVFVIGAVRSICLYRRAVAQP